LNGTAIRPKTLLRSFSGFPPALTDSRYQINVISDNSEGITAGNNSSAGAGKGFSMVVADGSNSGGLKEANEK
jgi:hypothetical protein